MCHNGRFRQLPKTFLFRERDHIAVNCSLSEWWSQCYSVFFLWSESAAAWLWCWRGVVFGNRWSRIIYPDRRRGHWWHRLGQSGRKTLGQPVNPDARQPPPLPVFLLNISCSILISFLVWFQRHYLTLISFTSVFLCRIPVCASVCV